MRCTKHRGSWWSRSRGTIRVAASLERLQANIIRAALLPNRVPVGVPGSSAGVGAGGVARAARNEAKGEEVLPPAESPPAELSCKVKTGVLVQATRTTATGRTETSSSVVAVFVKRCFGVGWCARQAMMLEKEGGYATIGLPAIIARCFVSLSQRKAAQQDGNYFLAAKLDARVRTFTSPELAPALLLSLRYRFCGTDETFPVPAAGTRCFA